MSTQPDKMQVVIGTEGTHVQGAQGVHVQGAQGVHVQGAQGVKWQNDEGYKRRLTLSQRRVLEQLAVWLKGREQVIPSIYRKLGRALGISQRAARVHVKALKDKGLLIMVVVYRPESRQKIGVRISIADDAPIKRFPHKLSKNELQEMEEGARKDAQLRSLMRRGYTYIKELDVYVGGPGPQI